MPTDLPPDSDSGRALEPPVITWDALRLRPWRGSDGALILRAARDPDIARYSTVGVATTPAAAEAWLRARHAPDRFDWVLEKGKTPVGRVSLASIDRHRRTAEIGYWVLPEFRRAGIASAAAAAAIDVGQSRLALAEVRIEHEGDNRPSCAIAQRLGFSACHKAEVPVIVAGRPRQLWVHRLAFRGEP